MTITIRLFAVLREHAGVSEFSIDLPRGACVNTARDRLVEIHPVLAPQLSRVAFAVNRCYVPIETELHDGEELALIPPVSGG